MTSDYQEPITTSPDPRDGHVHIVEDLTPEGAGQTEPAAGDESESHAHNIVDFKVEPMEAEDGSYTSKHPGELPKPEMAAALKDQKFTGEKNKDGTFNIRNVPIFADHKVPGTKQHVGSKWLNAAVKKNQQRFAEDGFKAPLHIQHHGKGSKPEPAGFFMPTGVKAARFEGKDRDVIFADLLEIPKDKFEQIRKGLLPFRSVEILDLDSPEISSLALLDTEVPFFRFKPLKVNTVKKANRLVASAQPAIAYRLSRTGRALLFNFGAYTMADEIKKSDEVLAEHDDENVEETPTDDMAGMMKALIESTKANTEMLKAIVEKLGVEEEVEEEELGPAEPEDEAEVELNAPAKPAVAATAQYSAMQTRVKVLEGYKRDQERKSKIAGRVEKAKSKLTAYHLDDGDLKDLTEAATEGDASVARYVATMKKYRDPEPTSDFNGEFGVGNTDAQELQVFSQSPDNLAKARVYSAQYDDNVQHGMNPGVTRLQFIHDQMDNGTIVTEEK